MHIFLQYSVICLPLIIAAYVPRTITEGVFSTSQVVVLSIKMYVCSLSSFNPLQFTIYMWSPVLCYKNYQNNSSRNYKKIILHFIQILLICLWNSYFIQYELSRIYINLQFISLTKRVYYYITIFVIFNFQLIFIDGFVLFKEITYLRKRFLLRLVEYHKLYRFLQEMEQISLFILKNLCFILVKTQIWQKKSLIAFISNKCDFT